MKKLCFSCMRRIPLFASRCPYCIDENQGVFGRLILVIAFIIGIIILAQLYGG